MMARRACAIYTRKSSDEGLDQAFNSLDAQREAGEAYIRSQASEGWRIVADRYDDGGYSGGTMERPALRRLLDDIDAGKIDVVIVYKIDRLTRSLADFARIVERFDARGTSFVSVTQAFNTTSSMGRLTLNVLLSFAQFEREVTGERIRDKIAASKAKGMWMGGIPPLGYDLPQPGSRMLEVNAQEAGIVRSLFARYLELGSVHRLVNDLADEGLFSKSWTTQSGRVVGGAPYSRGALFHILKNRLYLGEIVHKGIIYPGLHQPIIEQELFEAVALQLEKGRRRKGKAADSKVATALFAGRLFDASGEAMTPAFSYGRNNRVYRYYVSASLQQGGRGKDNTILRRISAPALEQLVTGKLGALVVQRTNIIDRIERIMVARHRVVVTLPADVDLDVARCRQDGVHIDPHPGRSIQLTVPVELPLRGGRLSRTAGRSQSAIDATLVGALRKAHSMLSKDKAGMPLIDAAPRSPYDRRLLRLAFLAPDLQRAIIEGTQPRHINLEYLVRREIPLEWSAQRHALAWNQ